MMAQEEAEEKSAEVEHSIRVTYVDLPDGTQILVANNAKGEQIVVSKLEDSDITHFKRDIIDRAEAEGMKHLDEESGSLEDMSYRVRQITESSHAEGEDMAKIMQLLESKKDVILFVDSDNIHDSAIPTDGALHLLVKKTELESVSKPLEDLGYESSDLGDIGVISKKGESKIIFLFAEAE